jgi:hypothetical protein
MGDVRNAYKILVGKLESKKQIGRPMRMWYDNIKMYLKKDISVWAVYIWLKELTNVVMTPRVL